MFARPASLLTPASDLSAVHRILSFYCLTSGTFQEYSILHILNTQRLCSVSVTTASGSLCSLLRDYHRVFLTGFEPSFQRGARIGNIRGLGAGREAEDFTQSSCALFFILHKACQVYFDFTQIFSALFLFSFFVFCSSAEGTSELSVE